MVVAAAMTERVVDIKKGQFVPCRYAAHRGEMPHRGDRQSFRYGARNISSFGYNNLVVDMRSLAIMREVRSRGVRRHPLGPDCCRRLPMEITWSAEASRNSFPVLARAAVAAGVDGVFMEVHDNPKDAKSDGANALESTRLREVLKAASGTECAATRQAVNWPPGNCYHSRAV